MKITYLGNFGVSWCTENLIARTMGRLGHEVTRVQENQAELYDVVKKANDSDLFFWSKTPNWLTCDGDKMIDMIKVPKIGHHLDIFIGIDREKEVKTHPFFRLDYLFQTDGSEETMRKYKEYGVNAYYFPAATSKEECYLAPQVDRYKHDVVFIGTYDYHREWAYRSVLIDWLRSVYGKRFCLYPKDTGQTTMGHELNQLCASAKIVVGDSYMARDNYWSNRVPEMTGKGGVLIHPRVKGIEDYYTDQKHLLLYDVGDFEGLKELIEFCIHNTGATDIIRREGMLHTKNNHTFDERLKVIFETIK